MTDKLPIITRVEFFEAESLPRPLVEVSARPFSSLSIRHNGKITVKADGRTLLSASDTLTFIPGGRARQERYADYRARKLSKAKERNNSCILVTGLIFLFIGIALTVIWNVVFYNPPV